MRLDVATSELPRADLSLETTLEPMALLQEQTVSLVVQHFGSILRSVVLTGSLAREEGTFLREAQGWKLLGDADFFLVVRDGMSLPSREKLRLVAKELTGLLARNGLIASVGLSAIFVSYFRALPRHILTYELRRCGRVVWGDAAVLAFVRDFTPAQIMREDAWRMLANRMIELLEALEAAPGKAHYCAIKLYLDMATSYLVFVGRYMPTYRGRERELLEMREDSGACAAAPFDLQAFASTVSACTGFKLQTQPLSIAPDQFLGDAIQSAGSLWNWELKQLTGETRPISSSELMPRWMAQQPLRSRIRGWASVVRRCKWHRSWRDWPRWVRLGWQASPRYWVYSVAAEVLFRSSPLVKQERESNLHLRRLATRLPLPNDSESQPALGEWHSLARLTALNYHRLLETTTA